MFTGSVDMLNLLFAPLLIATAFLIALAALGVFALFDRRNASQLRRFSEGERDSIVLLFENERLLDATPAARQLLATAPQRGSVWAHFSALLSPRFPKLSERVRDLADLGELELTSEDGTSSLRAEWHDGIARITLEAADPAKASRGIDSHSLLAMSQELESLRATSEHIPFPAWREDHSGAISWCNAAYLALCDSINGVEDLPPWPPARVFDRSETARTEAASDSTPASYRFAITPAGETTRFWFDVTEIALDNSDRLFVATPADKLVHAETSLKEFVATLTKTFAALPIGMAIFNRSRELALFNPALMDLTMLPAEFLISRPSLSAFLDRLREARMMPEPKDYRSWRRQISDLVAAAQNGTYEETWALPSGQTYRITGRPHPDGAVALLFEDISAEISVARRFRAELEIGQSTLDALPQAVAVFSTSGTLTISNSAYAAFWGNDPSTMLGETTLRDAARHWQARCAPSPVWEKLQAFVSQPGLREAWAAQVVLADGRALALHAAPLARGATLVSFAPAAATAATGDGALPARSMPAVTRSIRAEA